MRTLTMLPLALLAACGNQPAREATANNAAAAAYVPPPTQPPKPLPGQEHSNPITAYVGKYPGDAVDGVGFYDRTEVSTALIDAVGDEKTRRLFTSRDSTTTPIFAKQGRVASWGCEAHNCGDHNWTFLVRPDGTGGEACYHEAAMGDRSRWYARGAVPALRPGGCPSA